MSPSLTRPYRFLNRADDRARQPARRRLIVVAAGLALLILTLLPAMAVGAQSIYPPNTVVSTYYDARYGTVSVISDASGNLIDVNAATGQRIYPVYSDYTAYPNYAVNAAYPVSVATSAYVVPAYVNGNVFGYSGTTAYNALAGGRQYTDTNSNCTDSQVTQTASGFYCTATGTPAFRVS